MARDGFDRASSRIGSKCMCATFTLQVAAVLAQVAKQGAPFHPRVTVSRIASGGVPRRASSRRSCKMRARASARLLLASSFVLPCPFAPGISGQYAINHSSSCSIIAVNSLGIAHIHNSPVSLTNTLNVKAFSGHCPFSGRGFAAEANLPAPAPTRSKAENPNLFGLSGVHPFR